jgi:hypothetical protein
MGGAMELLLPLFVFVVLPMILVLSVIIIAGIGSRSK